MPVSVGVGPNKTLAKVASHFAKKYPGYHHCCLIDSEEKREKALGLYPVEEVWGVGRRYAAKLAAYGVRTALDFSQAARRLREGSFQQHRDLPHVGGAQRQGLRAERGVCEEEEHLHEQELRRDGGGPRHAEHTRGQLCGTVCGETEGAAQRGLGGGGVSPYQFLQGRPRPVLELRGDEDPHAHPLHRHAGADGQRRAEKDLPAGLPIQKGRRDRHGRLAREPSAAGPLRRDGRPIRQGKGLDEALDRINRTYGSETIVLGAQQYTRQGEREKQASSPTPSSTTTRAPTPPQGGVTSSNSRRETKSRYEDTAKDFIISLTCSRRK